MSRPERLGSWPLRACRTCAGLAPVLLDACREQQALLMERLVTQGR